MGQKQVALTLTPLHPRDLRMEAMSGVCGYRGWNGPCYVFFLVGLGMTDYFIWSRLYPVPVPVPCDLTHRVIDSRV